MTRVPCPSSRHLRSRTSLLAKCNLPAFNLQLACTVHVASLHHEACVQHACSYLLACSLQVTFLQQAVPAPCKCLPVLPSSFHTGCLLQHHLGLTDSAHQQMHTDSQDEQMQGMEPQPSSSLAR